MHREDASGMLCISTPLSPLPLCVAGILHPCCVCFWTWLTIVSLAVSHRRIYEGPLSGLRVCLSLSPELELSQEPGINRHCARHLWKRNRNLWVRNCHRGIYAISVQSMPVILMDGFEDYVSRSALITIIVYHWRKNYFLANFRLILCYRW